ncbi:MAG: transglutaminase-like domain-containing protein [Thermomicrobiales bacterium]
MDPISYFAEQSAVTDPGEMASAFADLPADIPSLRRIARGLVIHYRADNPAAAGIPAARMDEINTRYAERMLRRLFALDDRPLTEERPPHKRLVGCCRDFTVLFLAMLRHLGIPARARVGFAPYFDPGWNVDHEVAEVWDATEQRCRLMDAELADRHVDKSDGAHLDALDLPRDRFLVAGDAWAVCRAGEADPEQFLVDPSLEIAETRSWAQLRHNLIQDLAALNKMEMLLWDEWGLLGNGNASASEQELLDRIADVTRGENPVLEDVQSLYTGEPALKVPAVITSISPLTGQPCQVKVSL